MNEYYVREKCQINLKYVNLDLYKDLLHLYNNVYSHLRLQYRIEDRNRDRNPNWVCLGHRYIELMSMYPYNVHLGTYTQLSTAPSLYYLWKLSILANTGHSIYVCKPNRILMIDEEYFNEYFCQYFLNIGPCSPNPCINAGKCHEDKGTQQGFYCTCLYNYTGPNCETRE